MEKLEDSPDLKLRASNGPHKTFEKTFVPAYKANLASGMSEQNAKLCGQSNDQPPSEQFLLGMLASTAAMRRVHNHQEDRADKIHKKIDRAHASAERATKSRGSDFFVVWCTVMSAIV
jgi:hypothetical protein